MCRQGWVERLVALRRQDPLPQGRVVPAPWPTVPAVEDEGCEPALALPEAQRQVVAMRLAGGLSAPEIAEALGKPAGAVKALQHRALVNLTKALGGAYPRVPGGRLEEREENFD